MIAPARMFVFNPPPSGWRTSLCQKWGFTIGMCSTYSKLDASGSDLVWFSKSEEREPYKMTLLGRVVTELNMRLNKFYCWVINYTSVGTRCRVVEI